MNTEGVTCPDCGTVSYTGKYCLNCQTSLIQENNRAGHWRFSATKEEKVEPRFSPDSSNRVKDDSIIGCVAGLLGSISVFLCAIAVFLIHGGGEGGFSFLYVGVLFAVFSCFTCWGALSLISAPGQASLLLLVPPTISFMSMLASEYVSYSLISFVLLAYLFLLAIALYFLYKVPLWSK